MKRIAAITTALLCLSLSAHAQKKPEHSFEQTETTDTIKFDDQVFTTLVRGKTDEYGEARQPFFYPIVGPTGAKMTRNYPMVKGIKGESDDHPHHQSLWLAHGNVNGVDFWHDKKAKIQAGKTQAFLNNTLGPNGVEWPYTSFAREDKWIAPNGKAVLINKARYAVDVYPDGSRVLELWQNLSPAEGAGDVTFGDTKEGTMAIRLAPQLRLKGEIATGKAINSNGDKDAKVWGKRAKWVAYWGVIDGKTCGVAIFDHPTNLRHPTWWHARDYGLVAANPFGISDFEKGKHKRGAGKYTVKQGESLNLQYRFVFFAGTAEEADIAGKYDQWVKETAHANGDELGEWTPLFNGKDLAGWTAKPGGEWKVVDGAIVGVSEASEKRHGLLVSDKAYDNFTVKLKFKVAHGNSGFYFRSKPIDHTVGIKGFQAEVDKTMATGGLYETLGRAWVKKTNAEEMKKLYRPGEWTDMTVHADGGTIQVSINGQQVADLKDDPGASKGHFALQLHGGDKMDVAFKGIYIREITPD